MEDNLLKYNQLRSKYHTFYYHEHSYRVEGKNLVLCFHFSIDKSIHFQPVTIFKWHSSFALFFQTYPISVLENFVFNIGMIELISYWKSTCCKKIEIQAGTLPQDALYFWKKLYFNGLGEFFYCNGIDTNIDNFAEISIENSQNIDIQHFTHIQPTTIVPVGGGKDSIVTLELLRNQEDILPLIINPRQATLETVKIAGFEGNFIEIQRKIDDNLLEINKKGFLNGHTPFSSMLAFYSVLAAVLTGRKNIALSNESSANEATVLGENINHQYSKSLEFEEDFRRYVAQYLSEDVYYYSFLRNLSELEIAQKFSCFESYFPFFKSCNVGSKTDVWCCKCAKCLFTFIILSPFISPQKLEDIFGENLLDNPQLLPILKQLCGFSPTKPFECVGTIEEVNTALTASLAKYEQLPVLLQYFLEMRDK